MAIANNVSLRTNLNVDPYYDDFDETKNFHRFLYRPGLAVQARELTQMQTILQNQIDRVGEHLFKEGSVVRGIEGRYDIYMRYIKLKDGYGAIGGVSSYVDQTIVGLTNGIEAKVIAANTGSEAQTPNLATLYIKYTKGSTTNTAAQTFEPNEKIQIVGTATSNGCVAELSETPTGFAGYYTVNEGVIYVRDHFVRVPTQAVIVSKYAANTASARIGFQINESIVTSSADSTLLDPAQGAYNYTAPGADRLKITADLLSVSYANNDPDFIEIARVKDGVLQTAPPRTAYNAIRDYMATRTFDESGHYTVRGLMVRLREHLDNGDNNGFYPTSNPNTYDQPSGNNELLIATVDAGKAYVGGYDIDIVAQQKINVKKGIDVEQVEGLTVPAQYGNYIIADNVVGEWDFNTHPVVSLRNASADAVSNSEYSTTSAVGAEIGTARVRSVQHYTGTMGAASGQYKIYLYDITMSGAPFGDVRSLYINNTSTADAKADPILVSGSAKLYETDFNKAVYNIPASNIKTLRDGSNQYDTLFKFHQKFAVTIATNGTTTVTTSDASEVFPFSTGALSDSQVQGAFYLCLNADATGAALTGTVSCAAANTVTGSGTAFTTELNVGDIIDLGAAGERIVSSITDNTNLGILTVGGGTVSGVAFNKVFKNGQVIDLAGVGGQAANRSVTINTTTSATIDTQETFTGTVSASLLTELNKVDGQEMAKVRKAGRYVRVNLATHTNTTNGPWDLGFSDVWKINSVRTDSSTFTTATQGTDVTDHFELDSGQTDSLYKHAKLKKKRSSSLSLGASDYLLIDLDYFTHDTSQGVGYFSVDSYPIDDVNGSSANTNAITTQEIPFYTSPIDNKIYKLRDSLDFRPRITDTSTDTTTVSSGTTNPATSTTIVEPSGGVHFPPPNEDFVVDLQYYLKRIDRIVMQTDGVLARVDGTPALHPVRPEEPANSMTLAILNIVPYPSLTPGGANKYNRPEMASGVKNEKNKRFTMQDIGAIRDRVDNLEYYSSLNLLEKATKDLNIQDGSGNDRFKNGMLVDPFNGHGIGNVYNPDYSVAIDKTEKEARPKFRLDSVELEYDSSSTGVVRAAKDATVTLTTAGTYSNGESISAGAASGKLRYQIGNKLFIEQVSGTFLASATIAGASSGTSRVIDSVVTPKDGDLVMLPYNHDIIIDQPLASSSRSCAGLMWSWAGDIQLNPDNDYWTDTTTRPDVNINFDLNTDNWVAMANSWETEWNDWQTTGVGVSEVGSRTVSMGTSSGGPGSAIIQQFGRETTMETSTRQTRQGVRTTVTPEQRVDRMGARTVDMSIIPFMRSRVVQFAGFGLKPNTRLFSFFDGEDVSAYITPSNAAFGNTGVQGSNVVTDSTGTVYGHFTIPNNDTLKFSTGNKKFRLTDSEINSRLQGKQVTSAEANYSASGLHQVQEETVLSTRYPAFNSSTVSETRTMVSRQSSVTPTGSTIIGWVPVPDPGPTSNDVGGDDGDGDSSCFVKGTLVRLADGSDKKIEEVEIGDVLIGMDGAENKVLEFDHPMLDGRDLVGINGSGPLMTPEHPLMTKDGWKAYNVDDTLKAYPHLHEIMEGNLAAGDKILDVDGNWIMIESMELYEGEEDQQVYNFILDGNNTYHANGFLAHNRDPVAQSFILDQMASEGLKRVDGIFCTKVDLYFQNKNADLGALIEIREMNEDGTNPTNIVLPFGHVNLTKDEIYISDDASVATPIVWPSPVYLKNTKEYCIVVTPHGFNPDLRIWVARIGEKDTLTDKPIIKNAFAGTLFASAADRKYTDIQEEDYKFKLYAANTSIERSTGDLVLTNANKEFLTIANQSGGTFNSIGEMVYGSTTLNLGSSPTVNTATEYANGVTSAAKGVLEYASGSTIRVKHQGPNANVFQSSETIRFYYTANNTYTGNFTTIASIVQPKGKIYHYDNVNASNTYMYLANTSGQFYAEQTLTLQGGSSANARARIVSIDNLRSDLHMLQVSTIEPPGTAVVASAKMATSSSTLDSTFRNTTVNENNSLDASRFILSRSNEIANLSSNRSINYKLVLSKLFNSSKANKRITPVVDLQRVAVTNVKNLVNNVNTNEANTAGGDSLSKYISRTVSLADGQDAEDMVVYLNAYKPATANIYVYYKIVNAEDADGIVDASWQIMEEDVSSGALISDGLDTGDFNEYKYKIPSAKMTGGGGEVQYTNSEGVTFTGYKHFAVKIVFNTSDSSNVPRVRDFRAIALQM